MRHMIDGLVKLERAAWIARMADESEVALATGNMGKLYEQAKSLKAKSVSKPQPVRIGNANGDPAVTYHQERCNVRDYFAGLLGGQQMSFADLVDGVRVDEASHDLGP
eukprot:12398142-Karenia_brevis.AAC.2